MDFLGDIVEKEVEAPVEVSFDNLIKEPTNIKISKKPSKWKQRLQEKKISSTSEIKSENQFEKELDKKNNKYYDDELTEKEKIHLENLKFLASMSPEELANEREELMASIDPKILNSLMNKSKKGDEFLASKKEIIEEKEEIEEEIKEMKIEKKVTFNEEKEIYFKEKEYEEPVPSSEQLLNIDKIIKSELFSNIHFPKNPKPESEEDYKIDLNDPEFLNKLHEKYFPDLPKDTKKLKWMEPIKPIKTTDNFELRPEEIRFDFNGSMIIIDSSLIAKIPQSSGLFHHGDNPELPGYTLKELAHLSRSKFNSQRCIAIRTIGRILHKLSLHKFNIIDENGKDSLKNPELKELFENKVWEQVIRLQIISILEYSANEKFTKNLSIRNYSIEALWLWRQAEGEKQMEKVLEQLEIEVAAFSMQ